MENREMLRILGLSDRLLQRYEKQNTNAICSILKHQEGLVERKHIHREDRFMLHKSPMKPFIDLKFGNLGINDERSS